MTDDLAARLLAAIDETDTAARKLNARHPGPWRVDRESMPTYVEDVTEEGVAMVNGDNIARHIARHDPAAVLRRCAADKKQIWLHSTLRADDDPDDPRVCMECGNEWPCETLQITAEGYGLT